MGLLDAGGFQVFENDLGEIGSAVAAGFFAGVDDVAVFIDAESAVGGEAFDGEGAGDADFFIVFVGLVVKVFIIGFGGDGGVDFFLAGDAEFPPGGVEFFGFFGPIGFGFAGDFPLLPRLFEGGV